MSATHLTLEQRMAFEKAEDARLYSSASLKYGWPMPDNASTELALIKLLSDQLADFRALSTRLERLEHKTQHQHTQIMTALETLTASVNANTVADGELTTAVNAAIVQLGKASPTDAQLLTLAGQIDTNTATTKAQTDAINVALTPVTPPTP